MSEEVGVGHVRIIPVLKGFSAEITSQLGAIMGKVAKKAGDDAGDDLARGIVKAAKKAGKDAGDALTSSLKGLDWPAPTGLPKAMTTAARKAGDDVADVLGNSVKNMNWPAPTGLARGVVPAARRAGGDAGDAMSEGIADGVDSGHGRLRSAAGRAGDIFKLGLAAAGVAAGALLVTGVSGALEQEGLRDKFEASLGFPAEAAGRMGDIAGSLYLEGFGDSITDTGDVVARVLRNGLLPEDATDAQIERLSTKILTFTDVMAQDMDMTTQAISTMIKSGLADSSEQALDILTAGTQQGLDKAGDLLETFQEYSPLFDALGLSAEDASGLMIQGLDGGARSSDLAADAIKEFGIRAQDGSALSAEGFRILGLNAEDMTAKVAAGGDSAREALGQTLDRLREIEDPALRNAAAVALFGTQAEDLGDALFEMDLDTAADRLGDYAGKTDELGSAYDNASARIEVFKRKALDKLVTFIGNTVIPGVERLVEVLGPPLAEALGIVQDAIADVDWSVFTDAWDALTSGLSGEGPDLSGWQGTLQDFGDVLADLHEDVLVPFGDWLSENGEVIAGALVGIGIALGIALAAIVGPALVAAAPFILIAAAVAGLVGGLIWLYDNVESFRTLVQTAWPIIQEIFTTALGIIQNMVETTIGIISFVWENWGTQIVAIASAAWEMVQGVVIGALNIISGTLNLILALMEGDWSAAWEAIKQIVTGAWQVIWAVVSNGLKIIWNLVVIWWGVIVDFWSAILGGLVADIRAKLNTIIGFFQALPGRISGALSGVASALIAPFSRAFDAIKGLWNATIGRLSLPSWVSGVKSIALPKFHSGGIVPGPVGSEQLAILQGGEAVFTQSQMAAIGSNPAPGPAATTRVLFDMAGADQEMARLVRRMVKVKGGGDVQLAFGGRR